MFVYKQLSNTLKNSIKAVCENIYAFISHKLH